MHQFLVESSRVISEPIYLYCAGLSHSVLSNSATPGTVAHQAPLPMGTLQARILEWVAMPSSRGPS